MSWNLDVWFLRYASGQTDKHTDTLITILRILARGWVKTYVNSADCCNVVYGRLNLVDFTYLKRCIYDPNLCSSHPRYCTLCTLRSCRCVRSCCRRRRTQLPIQLQPQVASLICDVLIKTTSFSKFLSSFFSLIPFDRWRMSTQYPRRMLIYSRNLDGCYVHWLT